MIEYLRTSDVARLLGVSAVYVRQLERTGKLPAIKTAGGFRVFRAEDVQNLAEERKARIGKARGPGR